MPTPTMQTWTFPTLYKKTSTGAIQFWDVAVEAIHENSEPYGRIRTTYGQAGTDSPQVTEDVISCGKNAGKKSETTAVEQAVKEAEARWLKQKKKGYVEDAEVAEQGYVDTDVISGGISPMLSEKYADQGHKISFPCFGQPKLDGIRCIADIKNGKATLWTRTRKPITSMEHIVRALEAAFPSADLILDGELYSDQYSENFEQIVSLVRKEKDLDISAAMSVEYHVYDLIEPGLTFASRWAKLGDLIADAPPVRLVSTTSVTESSDVPEFFRKCRDEGYEGAMLRNISGLYAHRRSPELQKVKEFDDAEFPIIGVDEGRGKLSGHAGSFVCKTPSGAVFNAKMKGGLADLKAFFEDHSRWNGKQLQVQYQGFTKDGIPRFPIGIRIRESEDF